MRVFWILRDELLKYCGRILRSIQIQQADSILSHRRWLRRDELFALLKMLYRSFTIMLFVGSNGQHRMSRKVIRPLLKYVVEVRYSMSTVRLILELDGAFQRGQIVRRNT